MNDLISRRDAIDALRAMQTYKLFMGDDLLLIDQAGAMAELMMLPTAEPIIRCRDCEWRDGSVCLNNNTMPWSDDDFCSMAERRTDGRDD